MIAAKKRKELGGHLRVEYCSTSVENERERERESGVIIVEQL